MSQFVLIFQKLRKLPARLLNLIVNRYNDHTNANKYVPTYPGDKYEHWASAIRFDNISLEEALQSKGNVAQPGFIDTKCATLVLSSDSNLSDEGYTVDESNAQHVFANAISYASTFDEAEVHILNGSYVFTSTLECNSYIELVGESRDSVRLISSFTGSNSFKFSKGTFRNITFIHESGTYFIGESYGADSYPIDLIFDNCKFEFNSWTASTAGIYVNLTLASNYAYNRIIFNNCEFVQNFDGSGITNFAGLIYCWNSTTCPVKMIFNKCEFKYGTDTATNFCPWINFYAMNQGYNSTGWNSSENNISKVSLYRCNFYPPVPGAPGWGASPLLISQSGIEMYHCNVSTIHYHCIDSFGSLGLPLGMIFGRLCYNNFTTGISYGAPFDLGEGGYYNNNLNTICYLYNISNGIFDHPGGTWLVLYGNTNIALSESVNPLFQDTLEF